LNAYFILYLLYNLLCIPEDGVWCFIAALNMLKNSIVVVAIVAAGTVEE